LLLNKLSRQLSAIVQPLLMKIEARVKAWIKPASDSLWRGIAIALVKRKPALIVENAFLRQQVIVLKRQIKQPKLTPRDRGLLVLLASRLRGWKDALLIVKPDTLLKWHQQGFKLFWRHTPHGKARRT
jgi:putative transposase